MGIRDAVKIVRMICEEQASGCPLPVHKVASSVEYSENAVFTIARTAKFNVRKIHGEWFEGQQ